MPLPSGLNRNQWKDRKSTNNNRVIKKKAGINSWATNMFGCCAVSVWMLFWTTYSLLWPPRAQQRNARLRRQQSYYEEIRKKEAIKLLKNDDGVEKYAREKWHMKKGQRGYLHRWLRATRLRRSEIEIWELRTLKQLPHNLNLNPEPKMADDLFKDFDAVSTKQWRKQQIGSSSRRRLQWNHLWHSPEDIKGQAVLQRWTANHFGRSTPRLRNFASVGIFSFMT